MYMYGNNVCTKVKIGEIKNVDSHLKMEYIMQGIAMDMDMLVVTWCWQ